MPLNARGVSDKEMLNDGVYGKTVCFGSTAYCGCMQWYDKLFLSLHLRLYLIDLVPPPPNFVSQGERGSIITQKDRSLRVWKERGRDEPASLCFRS